MSSQQVHSLRYAVRTPVVLKYTAMLALMLGALNVLPLALAIGTQEWGMAWRLGLSLAVLAAGALPLARLKVPAQVQVNEALTVIVLAFVLGSAVMAWPFTAFGISPLDAWFESVSGITTTGLSTLASVQDKPVAFLLSRAWMQWYGGLGMVVLSVGLLLRHSAASRRLALADASGESLISTTRTHARRVLGVYLLLSAFGLFGLWALSGDFVTALAHTLSAVSTGGFSTFDDSIAGWHAPWAERYATTLAWCGAVSLPVYYLVWQRGWRALTEDVEWRALLLATVLLSAAVYWLAGSDTAHSWQQSVLLAASAQTTTGFEPIPAAGLNQVTQLALIVAMFVGGSIGSSAGGIKLFRLMVLLQFARFSLLRTGAPQHAVMEPRLAQKKLQHDDLTRALLLITLFAGLIIASWFVFLLHGYDAMDALFEVVSASATVGMSAGLTRPELEPLLKIVLCIDMLAGRVEVLALLVVLYPGTWFGKRMDKQ